MKNTIYDLKTGHILGEIDDDKEGLAFEFAIKLREKGIRVGVRQDYAQEQWEATMVQIRLHNWLARIGAS